MIYLKWFLLLLVNLFAKQAINLPLAPVIVLFADDAGWLPNWLYWFQTPDNPLDDDPGWKTENRPYLNESNMKFGVLFNPYAFWIGVHYSIYNRRVCINVLPMLTIWIVFKGGIAPKSCR